MIFAEDGDMMFAFFKNMDKIFSTMGFVYPTFRKSRKPAYKRVLCFKWGNRDIESHPGINIGS